MCFGLNYYSLYFTIHVGMGPRYEILEWISYPKKREEGGGVHFSWHSFCSIYKQFETDYVPCFLWGSTELGRTKNRRTGQNKIGLLIQLLCNYYHIEFYENGSGVFLVLRNRGCVEAFYFIF